MKPQTGMMSLGIAVVVVISLAARARAQAVVHNDGPGEWANKTLELVEEVSIGAATGDEYQMLGRVSDIAVDSHNNIYILDTGYMVIRKYDSRGRHLLDIGRSGEGPGEFYLPTAIAVDLADRVYVAGLSSQVRIFDPDGTPAGQFDRKFPGNPVRSMRVGPDGSLYVSSLDIFDQQIIHKYDSDHSYLFSFCDSYAIDKDLDVRIENVFAGGEIDIDEDGFVYFTQMAPYEIRKFSPEGQIVEQFERSNDFMPTPTARRHGDELTFTVPTQSAAIVVLDDNTLLNVVKKPPVPDPPAETIIDLFDTHGRLLISRRFESDMNVLCRDRRGRVWAVRNDEYPQVVCFKVAVK